MNAVNRVQILTEAIYISQSEVLIKLFNPHIWLNSWTNGAFLPRYGNRSTRKNSDFMPFKLSIKFDLLSLPVHGGGVG